MCLTSEAFDALSNAEKRDYVDRVAAAKDAEIAKLRAERDEIIIRGKNGTESLHAEIAQLERLRDELRADLAAVREALSVEREACDEARRCAIVRAGLETGTDVIAFRKWRRKHDQRRAAEMKALKVPS